MRNEPGVAGSGSKYGNQCAMLPHRPIPRYQNFNGPFVNLVQSTLITIHFDIPMQTITHGEDLLRFEPITNAFAEFLRTLKSLTQAAETKPTAKSRKLFTLGFSKSIDLCLRFNNSSIQGLLHKHISERTELC